MTGSQLAGLVHVQDCPPAPPPPLPLPRARTSLKLTGPGGAVHSPAESAAYCRASTVCVSRMTRESLFINRSTLASVVKYLSGIPYRSVYTHSRHSPSAPCAGSTCACPDRLPRRTRGDAHTRERYGDKDRERRDRDRAGGLARASRGAVAPCTQAGRQTDRQTDTHAESCSCWLTEGR